MLVVRPVTKSDLEALVHLALQAHFGLTTLPPDRDVLRKRIARSDKAFGYLAEEPGGETYTFVMEDPATGAIVGTSSIVSKVGGFEPFYAYLVEMSVHESKELNIHKEVPTLTLVTEHSGPSEIGGLFMAPDQRGRGQGRLMSLCRFLFMAEHPHLFEPTVAAEMRGVVDENGRSPFWEALGRHFFEIEFPSADYMSMKNKKFIADLMPRNPIYIPLLPKEAQAVIGEVHPETRPALNLLLGEGFRPNGMVDIFEAGPIVSCPLAEIRTVKTSRRVDIRDISENDITSEPFLVCNTRVDFRACMSGLELLAGDGVRIPASCASALGVAKGDTIRFAEPRAKKPAG